MADLVAGVALGIPVGLLLAAASAYWLEPRLRWWPTLPCPRPHATADTFVGADGTLGVHGTWTVTGGYPSGTPATSTPPKPPTSAGPGARHRRDCPGDHGGPCPSPGDPDYRPTTVLGLPVRPDPTLAPGTFRLEPQWHTVDGGTTHPGVRAGCPRCTPQPRPATHSGHSHPWSDLCTAGCPGCPSLAPSATTATSRCHLPDGHDGPHGWEPIFDLPRYPEPAIPYPVHAACGTRHWGTDPCPCPATYGTARCTRPADHPGLHTTDVAPWDGMHWDDHQQPGQYAPAGNLTAPGSTGDTQDPQPPSPQDPEDPHRDCHPGHCIPYQEQRALDPCPAST